MSDQTPTTLPTYEECEERRDSGAQLTALEQFILSNEPAKNDDERLFREHLAAVVAEARNAR